jgi:adenine-specific DNA-methyltransferase
MKPEFSELRDRCGLELADIAADFNEPLDAVSRWEKGELTPPERVLRSLAILADFSRVQTDKAQDVTVSVETQAASEKKRVSVRQRKAELGQFMTPASVANFMASMFDLSSNITIRLLDAGAGHGALTTAFVEKHSAVARIAVTAFECDDQILPTLRANLALLERRANVECDLFEGDFLEEAANRICLAKGARYSHAILNPPYKKIGNDSLHRAFLRAAGLETVNLYSGFVGMAFELLEEGGELVAIIPRSFCNGPYYQPFRRFVLSRGAIRHIHLFDARNKAFSKDGVLQENVIIKLKRGAQQGRVTISTSTDDRFSDYAEAKHTFERIVFPKDSSEFIHIPTGDDKLILERASFNHTLADLGLTVSTGPVVDFRLREELRAVPQSGTVPLLYPGHFGPAGLQWPKPAFKKPNAIRNTIATRKWLYPNGYYTVVRRFSSKEEPRRIVASVIDPTCLPAKMIGIENHLNVFHTKRQPISDALAHGLAAYLNSTAVDTYFRRFNGHTQVNATDLRAMRYPSYDTLFELGHWAKSCARLVQDEIDERVNAF